MLLKTRGLVLSTINYSDKYILVQVFTETFGRVTYMVSKTKGKNTKVSRSLFSPLAILDLEVEHQASRDIQRIREARSDIHLYGISSDIAKTSMAFFLSEFLTRVLKDTNDSKFLFGFLDQSIQILDITEYNIANYHLVFMLKMSHFMGFYPNLEEYADNDLFDMINGEFVHQQPMHRHFLDRRESKTLSLLARISYENMHHFVFSRQDRVTVINKIVDYYRLHLYDFPALKSLDVLHELF